MINKISSKDEKVKEVCLNQLVRGELSAVEAYSSAIERWEDQAGLDTMKSIFNGHKAIVSLLKTKMKISGETPDSESGVWGGFVSLVLTGASLVGKNSILMTLKKGEEHGLRQCERLVDSVHLEDHDKKLISLDIMPQLQNHVYLLEKMNRH